MGRCSGGWGPGGEEKGVFLVCPAGPRVRMAESFVQGRAEFRDGGVVAYFLQGVLGIGHGAAEQFVAWAMDGSWGIEVPGVLEHVLAGRNIRCMEAPAALGADRVNAAPAILQKRAGDVGGGVLEHGEREDPRGVGLKSDAQLFNPVLRPEPQDVTDNGENLLGPCIHPQRAAEGTTGFACDRGVAGRLRSHRGEACEPCLPAVHTRGWGGRRIRDCGMARGRFHGAEGCVWEQIPLSEETSAWQFSGIPMKNPVPHILSTCLIVALQSSVLAAPEPGKAGKAGKTASPAGKAVAGAEKPAVSDPVAVVDGEEILVAEVDDALSQVLAQQGQSLGAVPAEQRVNFYRMLIEDLIVERLVKKRAVGTEVSKEQVDEVYRRATEGIPPDELKAQMKQVGQTEAKLRAQIQNNLQQREWMEKQVQGKDEVADAEAEAFYAGNLDKFKKPELVKASHILVSVTADATPETVLESEKKAKSLFERVKKGEDFAALAKEFSDDPGSKERGGDLDFFAKDQMVPEFAEAAFSLKKNEVSQPVRSQFGYHVIKATDRKPGGTATLAEAKPQLMAYLKRQKKQSAVEEVVRGLRAAAKVQINLPEPAPGVEAGQPAPR